jgi:hypothetical protein
LHGVDVHFGFVPLHKTSPASLTAQPRKPRGRLGSKFSRRTLKGKTRRDISIFSGSRELSIHVSVMFVAHAFRGGPIAYPLYADCGLDRVPALDLDAPRPRFRLSAPQETGTPAPADKRKRKVMRRRNSFEDEIRFMP